MNKIVALFSVYFLILCLLPCDDLQSQEIQLSNEPTISIYQNDAHADVCSSFCSCNCCGQIQNVTLKPLFSFDILSDFIVLETFYKGRKSQEFLNAVWLPPKNKWLTFSGLNFNR